jgi:hypothetical protein
VNGSFASDNSNKYTKRLSATSQHKLISRCPAFNIFAPVAYKPPAARVVGSGRQSRPRW